MSRIIPLKGDPHEEAQQLLPWYANGTLDESERAAVDAHLAECAACRAELAMDQVFCMTPPRAPLDAEQGWAALQRDMDKAAHKAPAVKPWRAPAILRRPIPLGWALSAQAAALALIVGAVRIAGPAQPVYQALSAPTVTAPGNIVVMFRPNTTARTINAILVGNHARLVNGPTVSGAYVLRVDGARRDAALTRLRSNGGIVLAEPIDDGERP